MINAKQITTNSAGKNRERFWELDFIRGICVLLMVFDHIIQLMILSNNKNLWDVHDKFMHSALQNTAQPIVRAIFFLVCGISCVLSKSNEKRGVKLFAVAGGVTFFTVLLGTMDSFEGLDIYFGVLHMLAVGILFYAVIATFSDNIPKIGKFIPAIFGLFWLIFFYVYIDGKIGDANLGYFPAIVGMDIENNRAGDYAPLFPEMAFVLIGTGLGQFYRSKFKNMLKPLDGTWNKPVCFIGRQALIVYILLPIVLGAIYSFV